MQLWQPRCVAINRKFMIDDDIMIPKFGHVYSTAICWMSYTGSSPTEDFVPDYCCSLAVLAAPHPSYLCDRYYFTLCVPGRRSLTLLSRVFVLPLLPAKQLNRRCRIVPSQWLALALDWHCGALVP